MVFLELFGTAIFWTVHRRQFGRITRSTAVLTGLNILLLGEITRIPVATRMIGELQYVGGGLWLYLGLCALIGLTTASNWVYDRWRVARRLPAAQPEGKTA